MSDSDSDQFEDPNGNRETKYGEKCMKRLFEMLTFTGENGKNTNTFYGNKLLLAIRDIFTNTPIGSVTMKIVKSDEYILLTMFNSGYILDKVAYYESILSDLFDKLKECNFLTVKKNDPILSASDISVVVTSSVQVGSYTRDIVIEYTMFLDHILVNCKLEQV